MGTFRFKSTFALGYQLFRRDIKERYTGTMFGWLWLLINPLFMLAVYTFIFGEVLQLRFGTVASTTSFAFYLFAGLLVFNALSEVMTRAPLVLAERRDMLLNTPLSPWLIPILPVASSILLEWMAVSILLVALALQGEFYIVGLLIYLPYFLVRVILSLAAAFFIAPLGVFLKDLRQLMPAILTVMLFVSPILYPLEVIPEKFQPFYDWNLLGQLVQGYRQALLEGVFTGSRFFALFFISSVLLILSILAFRSLMLRARYVL